MGAEVSESQRLFLSTRKLLVPNQIFKDAWHDALSFCLKLRGLAFLIYTKSCNVARLYTFYHKTSFHDRFFSEKCGKFRAK